MALGCTRALHRDIYVMRGASDDSEWPEEVDIAWNIMSSNIQK
jgi:hypothetical protein